MYRIKLGQFIDFVNNIPSFYFFSLLLILFIYTTMSWYGRGNFRFSKYIFSNTDKDTNEHIFRYSIFPTIVLIFLLSYLIINYKQNTNWFDYGKVKDITRFLSFIIFIIIVTILRMVKEKNIFGNDPTRIKSWIPFIMICLSIAFFITIQLLCLL